MQTSIAGISAHAPLPQEQTTLDSVYDSLTDWGLAAPLDDLFDDLSLRREDDRESWQEYARACLDHPLRHLLHQDPFTYRAFSKPRGYAGDAVMMDYIYGLGEAQQATSEATTSGRAIFSYMATRP